jgi:hypothetical protein
MSTIPFTRRFDDLFHLACCHPHDTFAFELEHAKASGFAGRATPVLQLVFQYLAILPAPGASPQQQRLVVQRRTRIATVAFPLADSLTDVFHAVNAPAVTAALVQQIIGTASSEERDDARRSLVDWLAVLTAAYNEWASGGEYEQPGSEQMQHLSAMDPVFSTVEAMQQVPRAVYAICTGPLLGAGLKGGAHPDAASALRTLSSTLPPEELAAAVYPQLSSWSAPDDLAFPRHSLSRAAMALSGQPIYLLDTYSSLIIYYTAEATTHGVPFPPPPGSALRRHVAAVRQARRVTPRVLMVREGEERAGRFLEWLIEDGGEEAGRDSFLRFLEGVKRHAGEYLEGAC